MKSIPLTENELKHIRETYELELERLQKKASEISGILRKLHGIATDDVSLKEETKAEPRTNKLTKTEKLSKPENLPAKAETKIKGKRGRPFKAKAEQQAIAKEQVTPEQLVPKKRGRKPVLKEVAEDIAKAQPSAKTVKAAKGKDDAKSIRTKKTAVKTSLKTEPKKRGRKPSDDSKKAKFTASILDILSEKGKVLTPKEIISHVMKHQDIPAAELQKTRSIINGSLSDLKLGTKKVNTMSVPGKKGQFYGLSQWFNELGQLVDPSRLQ